MRLRELFGIRDERAIARELNRPITSVRKMAEAVFRDQEKKSGPWTSEEVEALKRYLGANDLDRIARILGRTEEEVREQIQLLSNIQHTGRWSSEEIADLKKLYGTRTDEDLAIIFGRPVREIKERAQRYCLAKDKAFVRRITGETTTRMPRWDQAEIDRLRQLYPDHANLEIAKLLNRTVKSIVSKAHNLSLKKDDERLRAMGRENVSRRYKRSEKSEASENSEK